LDSKKIEKTGIEATASLFYFKLMQDLSVGRKILSEVYNDAE
jgi:hypothetical protein